MKAKTIDKPTSKEIYIKLSPELRKMVDGWMLDPCYDLKDLSEYPEEVISQLANFQEHFDKEQELALWQKKQRKAQQLECSVKTFEYIQSLEYRLKDLQNLVERLETRIDRLKD